MKKITIYTDGASRGNPGPAGVGVVFENEKGQAFKEYAHFLGSKLTNNEAEYKALVLALRWLDAEFKKGKYRKDKIDVYMDSQLIVKQLNGEYKIKSHGLKSLAQSCMEIINRVGDRLSLHFIKREKNHLADSMVNEELDRNLNQLVSQKM